MKNVPKKSVTAAQLDSLHHRGGSLSAYRNLSTAKRPGRGTQRINVDFPPWMVAALDQESDRLGITRQSLIKVWIAEALRQREASTAPAERVAED